MIEFLKELNKKEFINEGCRLYEGTHYDKEAAKILSEVCDIETAEKVIDTLIKEDWVSIFTHTNWIYKFLKPVARIYVEEVKKGKSLADVIQDTLDTLGRFLIFVKDNQNDKTKLFSFFDRAHYQDVEKFMDDYQKELEKQESTQDKSNLISNDYEVIKIDSYEQLHNLFGGKWTGDGKLDGAADNTRGRGKTAWCHANSEGSWNIHTKNGRYLFFVAAKKNWKEIPPEKTEGNPKDAYGLSLIAIVTSRYGKLLEATLRWNHVNVPNADHAFKTWAGLNRACGQDIEKECEKYFISEEEEDTSLFIINDGVLQRNPIFDDAHYEELELEEFSIPEGTKVIGERVFESWSNLLKVIIPNSVTSIGDCAFLRCDGLQEITIPNSVTSIGDDAFARCEHLRSIIIPDSVTNIGESAFYYCESLRDVKLPEGITTIKRETFFDCDSLENVTIPNSVTSIGNSAFYRCNNLTDIVIPDNVTNIGEEAFAYCHGLRSINIPDGVTSIGFQTFAYCQDLTSITIPNNVASIDEYAFRGCHNLKDIALSDNITSLSDDLFNGCRSLTTMVIPDSVTSIGNSVFYDCQNLTEITIPDSVTSIGNRAFQYCYNLKDVIIPDGVESIGTYTFASSGITSITIPNNVTSIDQGAFYDCSSLTSVIIPDSVISIDEGAFYNCKDLTSVTIPDNITSIGKQAFYGCDKLKTINCNNPKVVKRIKSQIGFK